MGKAGLMCCQYCAYMTRKALLLLPTCRMVHLTGKGIISRATMSLLRDFLLSTLNSCTFSRRLLSSAETKIIRRKRGTALKEMRGGRKERAERFFTLLLPTLSRISRQYTYTTPLAQREHVEVIWNKRSWPLSILGPKNQPGLGFFRIRRSVRSVESAFRSSYRTVRLYRVHKLHSQLGEGD